MGRGTGGRSRDTYELRPRPRHRLPCPIGLTYKMHKDKITKNFKTVMEERQMPSMGPSKHRAPSTGSAPGSRAWEEESFL